MSQSFSPSSHLLSLPLFLWKIASEIMFNEKAQPILILALLENTYVLIFNSSAEKIIFAISWNYFCAKWIC